MAISILLSASRSLLATVVRGNASIQHLFVEFSGNQASTGLRWRLQLYLRENRASLPPSTNPCYQETLTAQSVRLSNYQKLSILQNPSGHSGHDEYLFSFLTTMLLARSPRSQQPWPLPSLLKIHDNVFKWGWGTSVMCYKEIPLLGPCWDVSWMHFQSRVACVCL